MLREYYHHGKDIESYLRTHGRQPEESGRRTLADFDRAKEHAVEGFARICALLEEAGKPLNDD